MVAEPSSHVDRDPSRRARSEDRRSGPTGPPGAGRRGSAVDLAVLWKFHTRISWMTPTPMAATKATVRLTMAPTMAAVRARSRSSGLSTSVSERGLAGRGQDGGEGREHAGEVQATVDVLPDPDTRQAGRVGVLGHGPHGETPWRPLDERGEREGHDRRHDQGEHLAGREEVGADVKLRWTGTGNGPEEVLRADEGQGGERRSSTWLRPMVATITSTRGRLNRRRRSELGQRRRRRGQAERQHEGEASS